MNKENVKKFGLSALSAMVGVGLFVVVWDKWLKEKACSDKDEKTDKKDEKTDKKDEVTE